MIDIYDIEGNVLMRAEITSSAKREEELSKSDYISLSWNSTEKVVLPVGAYINHTYKIDKVREVTRRFLLLEEYEPTQTDEMSWKYTPEFQHPKMVLSKVPFYIRTRNSQNEEIKQHIWSFVGTMATIADKLKDFLNHEIAIGNAGWTVHYDETNSNTINVSFNDNDFISALSAIANAIGDNCEWHIDYDNEVIHLGKVSDDNGDVVLKVGENVGVPSISNSKESYYNSFAVFGGSRNITQLNNKGENISSSDIRLQLSKGSGTFNVDGKDVAYTIDEFSTIDIRNSKSEPQFTKVLDYSHIFPSLNTYVYNVRGREKYVLDNDTKEKIPLTYNTDGSVATYKTFTVWYMRLAYPTTEEVADKELINTTIDDGVTHYWYDFEITDNLLINGKNIGCSFEANFNKDALSTPLAGRGSNGNYVGFELTYHKEASSSHSSDDVSGNDFSVLAGDYEIVYQEDNGLIIPTNAVEMIVPKGEALPSLKCNITVLYNIVMADSIYIKDAQQRLFDAAIKEIQRLRSDLNNYTIKSYPQVFVEQNPYLQIGQKVTYDDGNGYTLSTRVLKLSTNIDYNFIQEITVGNQAIKGTITQLKDDVQSIIASGGGNGSGCGGYTESQLKNLIARYGTGYFLSKQFNDTAQGLITFVKGLISDMLAKLKGGATFGTGGYKFDEKGNVVVDALSSLAFDEALERGFGITKNTQGKYTLSVTDLMVWGKAVFNSLEIRKLYAVGGNVYLSGASSKIVRAVPVKKATDTGTTEKGDASETWVACAEGDTDCEGWKCYTLNDDGTTATQNGWRKYDQAKCQTFDIEAGAHEGVSNTFYWRLVADVSTKNETITETRTETYVDADGVTKTREVTVDLYDGKKFGWVVLSKTDCESTTNDAPKAGDTIVLDGHRMFASGDAEGRDQYNDESRTNVMMLETTGTEDGTLPRIVALTGIVDYRHWDGVNQYSNTVFILSPKEVVFVSSSFKFMSASGDPITLVNFRGNWAEGTKYGYYDQVSHGNAIWTCIVKKGDTTTAEPSDTSTDWRKEISGGKGDPAVTYELVASPSYIKLDADGSFDRSNQYREGQMLLVRGYKIVGGKRITQWGDADNPISIQISFNDGAAWYESTFNNGESGLDEVYNDFEPTCEDSYFSMLQEMKKNGLKNCKAVMYEGESLDPDKIPSDKVLARIDIPIVQDGKDGASGTSYGVTLTVEKRTISSVEDDCLVVTFTKGDTDGVTTTNNVQDIGGYAQLYVDGKIDTSATARLNLGTSEAGELQKGAFPQVFTAGYVTVKWYDKEGGTLLGTGSLTRGADGKDATVYGVQVGSYYEWTSGGKLPGLEFGFTKTTGATVGKVTDVRNIGCAVMIYGDGTYYSSASGWINEGNGNFLFSTFPYGDKDGNPTLGDASVVCVELYLDGMLVATANYANGKQGADGSAATVYTIETVGNYTNNSGALVDASTIGVTLTGDLKLYKTVGNEKTEDSKPPQCWRLTVGGKNVDGARVFNNYAGNNIVTYEYYNKYNIDSNGNSTAPGSATISVYRDSSMSELLASLVVPISLNPGAIVNVDAKLGKIESTTASMQGTIETIKQGQGQISLKVQDLQNGGVDTSKPHTSSQVDFRALDGNSFYPVMIRFKDDGGVRHTVEINRPLDGTYGSSEDYMTHGNGFSFRLIFSDIANGWGTNEDGQLRIESISQRWTEPTDTPICPKIEQYYPFSFMLVWLRGGSKYDITVDCTDAYISGIWPYMMQVASNPSWVPDAVRLAPDTWTTAQVNAQGGNPYNMLRKDNGGYYADVDNWYLYRFGELAAGNTFAIVGQPRDSKVWFLATWHITNVSGSKVYVDVSTYGLLWQAQNPLGIRMSELGYIKTGASYPKSTWDSQNGFGTSEDVDNTAVHADWAVPRAILVIGKESSATNGVYRDRAVLEAVQSCTEGSSVSFYGNTYFDVSPLYGTDGRTNVKPDLLATGIDIKSHKIVATADNFIVRNNSGTPTFSIDEDGNIVGSGGASFNGPMKATTFTLNSTYFSVKEDGTITAKGGQISFFYFDAEGMASAVEYDSSQNKPWRGIGLSSNNISVSGYTGQRISSVFLGKGLIDSRFAGSDKNYIVHRVGSTSSASTFYNYIKLERFEDGHDSYENDPEYAALGIETQGDFCLAALGGPSLFAGMCFASNTGGSFSADKKHCFYLCEGGTFKMPSDPPDGMLIVVIQTGSRKINFEGNGHGFQSGTNYSQSCNSNAAGQWTLFYYDGWRWNTVYMNGRPW